MVWVAPPDRGVPVEWRLAAGEELVSVALGGRLCSGGGWQRLGKFFLPRRTEVLGSDLCAGRLLGPVCTAESITTV